MSSSPSLFHSILSVLAEVPAKTYSASGWNGSLALRSSTRSCPPPAAPPPEREYHSATTKPFGDGIVATRKRSLSPQASICRAPSSSAQNANVRKDERMCVKNEQLFSAPATKL